MIAIRHIPRCGPFVVLLSLQSPMRSYGGVIYAIRSALAANFALDLALRCASHTLMRPVCMSTMVSCFSDSMATAPSTPANGG